MVTKLLDKLAEFTAQRDLIMLEKQEMINSVYTPEIKQQVADIEIEFAGKAETVNEKIADLTAMIKTQVLEGGATVKGQFLQAVWSKGRSKWDTKGLSGYGKVHPEIMSFYKQGKPSVSIRKVGK